MSFNLFPWPISRASTTTSIYKSTKRQMIARLRKRRLQILELCESAERSKRAVTSLGVKLPLRLTTLALRFHQFQEKFSFPSWMQQFAHTSLNPLHTLNWYWLDKFQRRRRRQRPTSSTTAQRGVYMVSVFVYNVTVHVPCLTFKRVQFCAPSE